jgi:hypothetical protein
MEYHQPYQRDGSKHYSSGLGQYLPAPEEICRSGQHEPTHHPAKITHA